jgi:Ca2+-binding EF-hand superfamily protein
MEVLDMAIALRRSREYKWVRDETRNNAVRWRKDRDSKLKQDAEKLRMRQENEEKERHQQVEQIVKLTREQLREQKKDNFRTLLAGGEGTRRKLRRGKKKEEEPMSPITPGLHRRTNKSLNVPSFGARESPMAASPRSTGRASFVMTDQRDLGDLARALNGRSSLAAHAVPTLLSAHANADVTGSRPSVDEQRQSVHVVRRYKSGAPSICTSIKRPDETPDQRIERIRRAKLMQSRWDRKTQEENQRQSLFESLAEDERSTYGEAFDLYEEQPGSGLDVVGLRKALSEIGFQGLTTEERAMILRVCSDHVPKKRKTTGMDDDDVNRFGCDLYRFAVSAVSTCRTALGEHRKSKLQEECSNLKREEETGHLDACDLLAVVLDIYPVDVDTPDMQHGLAEVREQVKDFTLNEIDHFDEFANKLQDIAEMHQREANTAQCRIKDEFNLPADIFNRFRSQLPVLKWLFHKLEKDADGMVDMTEMLTFFSELQILPDEDDQENYATAHITVREATPLNFQGFLNLIKEFHDFMEITMEQHTSRINRLFDQLHVDDEEEIAPYVKLPDVEAIFKDVGVATSDPKISAVMRRLLSMADPDGKGHLMLDAVKRLYLALVAQVQQAAVWRKYDLAERLLFQTKHMREMQDVFDELDHDGSLLLEPSEVREACTMLRLDISGKDPLFDVAFSMIEKEDPSGLNFLEFLKFLKMARDHDGPFKDPAVTPVTTLKALDRMDLVLLLECFDDRDHAADKVMQIDKLLRDLCSVLGIESTTSLETAFSARTFKELLEHARWAQSKRSGGSARQASKR